MAKKEQATQEAGVDVLKVTTERVTFCIVGTTPFVFNAMSAKEWAELIRDSTGEDAFREFPIPSDYAEEHYGKPHRIAAECLYLQSFGFTREDVTRLRDAADYWLAYAFEQGGEDDDDRQAAAQLRSLADRIAALLPPEK